jgi:hypothetical protein
MVTRGDRKILRSTIWSGLVCLSLVACSGAADQAETTEPATGPQASPTTADAPAPSAEGGDALVAGTNYNATAQIVCAGYKGAAASRCDAGVIRNGADGATVEVTLADGTKRAIFFNPDGSFLSFSTAEADGTAAMAISSKRKGDVTIAKLGSETYEIPDVFVTGD